MANTRRYGLIEAGGTKFVLGIAEGTADRLRDAPAACMVSRHQIPTTTPDATMSAALEWLGTDARGFDGVGIASFGPLCLARDDPQWGHITRTTKPHWSGADLVGPLAAAFGCPVAIDTDVNAAALAEARWGVGRGSDGACEALLYLTIGTGIGGGFVMAGGRRLQGLSHPEMGHIRLPRHVDDTGFAGVCPFHGDCLEGLAAGPAIIARWGASLSALGPEHPGHAMIAWYLGLAICSFQAVLEPARIVLGGGVMGTPGLIDRVRIAASNAGGGYFAGAAETLVSMPALWPDSGLLGALALAMERAQSDA